MPTAAELQAQLKRATAGRPSDVQPSIRGDLVLAEKLTKLRYLFGLRQAEVADALGIGRTTLANIETGRQNVPLGLFAAFASFYEVSADELLSHLLKASK